MGHAARQAHPPRPLLIVHRRCTHGSHEAAFCPLSVSRMRRAVERIRAWRCPRDAGRPASPGKPQAPLRWECPLGPTQRFTRSRKTCRVERTLPTSLIDLALGRCTPRPRRAGRSVPSSRSVASRSGCGCRPAARACCRCSPGSPASGRSSWTPRLPGSQAPT